MGARRRMESAKGAVVGLLQDAYQRRDLVALVAFRGDTAEVVLRPTGSVEVARARLAELPTGGRTPLAAGLLRALEVSTAPARKASHTPLLVVITDGRATAAPDGMDPPAAALEAAAQVRRAGVTSVVLDVEDAGASLVLAAELAGAMDARHVRMADLTPAGVEQLVRESVPAPDRM